MAKRINVGYMSGYHSSGTIKTIALGERKGHEKYPREIDADIGVCLNCKKDRCTGKCKRVRDGKEKP